MQQYYLQPPVPQYMNDGFYPQHYIAQPVSYPYPLNTQPKINITYIDNWSSGLFSCYEDYGICCSTIFCCTCQSFNTKQYLNNETNSFADCICQICLCPCTYTGLWCFQGWYECENRTELKIKINFMDDNPNICKVICCLPCVICQHRREIKYRKHIGQLK